MKLSVVIPTRNSKHIIKAVESVFSSDTFSKLSTEIIVCDDCSDDDSVTHLSHNFPTVKVLRLEKKSGAAAARNLGILESKGDYILFMDSDIVLNMNSLRYLFESVKGFDMAFPKIIYSSGRVFYPVLAQEEAYPQVSACFLMKKAALSRMDEAFDENFGTFLEDADFFMRARLAGISSRYCREAHVIHMEKGERDYTERYYLELRNILYGGKKLGRLAKKTGAYNPFTYAVFLKCAYYGLINYAWFNWEKADRDGSKKIRQKNRIFSGSGIKSVPIILKAIVSAAKESGKARKKNRQLVNFYK